VDNEALQRGISPEIGKEVPEGIDQKKAGTAVVTTAVPASL